MAVVSVRRPRLPSLTALSVVAVSLILVAVMLLCSAFRVVVVHASIVDSFAGLDLGASRIAIQSRISLIVVLIFVPAVRGFVVLMPRLPIPRGAVVGILPEGRPGRVSPARREVSPRLLLAVCTRAFAEYALEVSCQGPDDDFTLPRLGVGVESLLVIPSSGASISHGRWCSIVVVHGDGDGSGHVLCVRARGDRRVLLFGGEWVEVQPVTDLRS